MKFLTSRKFVVFALCFLALLAQGAGYIVLPPIVSSAFAVAVVSYIPANVTQKRVEAITEDSVG